MQSLVDHARRFPAQIADRQAEFSALARGQQPQALFISCSDSRVMPAMITGAQPGEIFELRTAGNIIPRHNPLAACAVAGTLEFAVEALKAPDVIVCGHSHCGAVQGLTHPQSVRSMPLTGRWLDQAGHVPEATDSPDPDAESTRDARQAAQRHLLVQLDHLRTHPCVRRNQSRGLRLHAWFYDIETGQVLVHQPDARQFRPL